MFSGSKIIVDPLKNNKNHSRKFLTDERWTVTFSWIEVQAGITGKEIAGMAKQVAKSTSIPLFRKLPNSAFLVTLKKASLKNGVKNGKTQKRSEAKQYFSTIIRRVKIKIILAN